MGCRHAPAGTKQRDLDRDNDIALHVLRLEIGEQTSALADQSQQATTRMMVVRVRRKVQLKLRDSRSQERNLNLRRASVSVVLPEVGNNFRFPVRMQSHGVFQWLKVIREIRLSTPGYPPMERLRLKRAAH